MPKPAKAQKRAEKSNPFPAKMQIPKSQTLITRNPNPQINQNKEKEEAKVQELNNEGAITEASRSSQDQRHRLGLLGPLVRRRPPPDHRRRIRSVHLDPRSTSAVEGRHLPPLSQGWGHRPRS